MVTKFLPITPLNGVILDVLEVKIEKRNTFNGLGGINGLRGENGTHYVCSNFPDLLAGSYVAHSC